MSADALNRWAFFPTFYEATMRRPYGVGHSLCAYYVKRTGTRSSWAWLGGSANINCRKRQSNFSYAI